MSGERFTVGSVSGSTGKSWMVHDSAYCYHVVKTFEGTSWYAASKARQLAARLNADHEAWLAEVAA